MSFMDLWKHWSGIMRKEEVDVKPQLMSQRSRRNAEMSFSSSDVEITEIWLHLLLFIFPLSLTESFIWLVFSNIFLNEHLPRWQLWAGPEFMLSMYLTFKLLNLSQTISVGFGSGDCAGYSMIWSFMVFVFLGERWVHWWCIITQAMALLLPLVLAHFSRSSWWVM